MKFVDENGQLNDVISFNGYNIGDRTLEGVMIDVVFDDQGQATCSFRVEDSGYVNTLNKQHFLGVAKGYAEEALETRDMWCFVGIKDGLELVKAVLDDGSDFATLEPEGAS